jgi:hypothetical protein
VARLPRPPRRGRPSPWRRAPWPPRTRPLAPYARPLAPCAWRPGPRRRGSLAPSRAAPRSRCARPPAPCARPSRPRCAASALGSMDPWRGPCAYLDMVRVASRFPIYPTHSRVRSPTRAVIYSWFLINFKPCLVSVLRRTLRHATNLFNFRFY